MIGGKNKGNLVNPEKIDDLKIEEIVKRIITLNTNLATFWNKMCQGWADENTHSALSSSRMDIMVSFSHRTNDFFRIVDEREEQAHLVSCWVTIGALVESSLALFFTVYRNDYLKNPILSKKKQEFGKPVETNLISFEDLRCLVGKHELLPEQTLKWIKSIQEYRNAIHFFKDRKLGTKDDIQKALRNYLEMLRILNNHMPYPDDIYVPSEIYLFPAR